MAEDINKHTDPKSPVVSTSVFGPAIVKPDRSSSHLEDTLSLSFTAEHSKKANAAGGEPVKTPPKTLPNGEAVSGSSKPVGTLYIPNPGTPEGSASAKGRSAADKPIAFSDEMTAEIRSSGMKSNTRTYQTVLPYTSPFGPSGLEASRNVRSAEPPTSTLKIPEAKIDTGTIYNAYGENATDKSLKAEEVPLTEISKPISSSARFSLFDSLNEEEERKKKKERVLPKRSDRNRTQRDISVLSETAPASDDKTVISFTGKYKTSELNTKPHDTVELTAREVAEAQVIQFPTGGIALKDTGEPAPDLSQKRKSQSGFVEVPEFSETAAQKAAREAIADTLSSSGKHTSVKRETHEKTEKKDFSSLAEKNELKKPEVQPAVKPAVKEESKPETVKQEAQAAASFEPVSDTPSQKSVEETTAISFTSSVKPADFKPETEPAKPEAAKRETSVSVKETEAKKTNVPPAEKPAVKEPKQEAVHQETPVVRFFRPQPVRPAKKAAEETTAIQFPAGTPSREKTKAPETPAVIKAEPVKKEPPAVTVYEPSAKPAQSAAEETIAIQFPAGTPSKEKTKAPETPAVIKAEPVKKESPSVTAPAPSAKPVQSAAEETIAIQFPAGSLSKEKNSTSETPAVIRPEPKKPEPAAEPVNPVPAVIKADIPAVKLSQQNAAEETIAIQFPTASLTTDADQIPAVIRPEPVKQAPKKAEPKNPETIKPASKKPDTKKPETAVPASGRNEAVKTAPAKTETKAAAPKQAEEKKDSPFSKISSFLINTFTEPVEEETKPAAQPSSESVNDGKTMVIPVITKEFEESMKTADKRKTRTGESRSTSSGGSGGGSVPPSAPKRVKEPPRKRNGFLTAITVLLIIGILCELIVGVVGISIVAKMVRNSPNLSLTDFVGEESTKIYDDQERLVTEVGVYLRENVTYDKCPEALVDAFLAVEDSRFFSHFGFDIPRFTKAAIDNLKTHSFGQGGSTFTMQLVKNTYFSIESMDANQTGTERTKSIEYKVQQIYLAMKLENLLSKKEIFQLYLNKLNFGGNIRGVQRAAQYYFGKNCSELNLSEAAMLAGIVNLPNRYNPYEYLDYGTTRRDQVLDLMDYHGYITKDELKLAKAIKLENTLVGDHRKAAEDSQYQSYLDVVLEEAMKLTGCDPTVKGMKIYTHLNRSMQETVEAIQNGETNVQYPDDLMQVAMISMDNRTGAVIAVGGGRNYDGARLLNRATMNYKQPGSSVKPLLSYGLAFEYLGYTLDEVLIDKPITYPMESMVLVNADGNYHGDVTIKDALGNSLNIPAIITLERVVRHIGREKVVDYLQKIGFSRITLDNFNYSYAIGGTSFETTCMELAGAHSMLINAGIYNQPHTIKKVVMTIDGSEFYPTNTNVRALSSGSAYLVTTLEENNVSGPYFNWMQILKRDYPVYAKTGTTDWGKDGVQYGIPEGQMKDKWMVASTNQYTNCVWVGYDMAVAGKETYYTSYKSNLNIPGNINKLLLDKEEELYGVPGAIEAPSDIEDVTYIYGSFPHVRSEYSQGGGLVTSKASKSGVESMPLATIKEYQDYRKEEAKLIGVSGMSASYNQVGLLTVSWGNAGGACVNGQKDISLHDEWNDISMYGACLADLSWLSGNSGGYWGTVYCDDIPVGEFTTETGIFNGYVADLYGTVKVCGGSVAASANGATGACVLAMYHETSGELSGYLDENGNWISTPDYSQYGHWDDQGNWIGEGWWDENGFHH